jgi:hypothetical protein
VVTISGTPIASGTFNYTVTMTGGCIGATNTATGSITVNPLPSAAGTIVGTASVCQGQTAVSYSVASIAGATGYTWNLPTGASIASGANTNSITVNYSGSATSGNISVQGSNSCGNGAVSANFAVTVNAAPTVNAGPDQNFCSGSSGVTLSGSGSSPGAGSLAVIISGTGYLDEVSWTLTNNLGTVIGSGGNYAVGSSNTIPIGSAANGPYSFFLETQGSFNDNVTNYQINCNGNSVLSGTLNGGLTSTQSVASCLGPVTFSWSPATGLSSTSISNPIASPAATTNYTLTATANGCSSTASTSAPVCHRPS